MANDYTYRFRPKAEGFDIGTMFNLFVFGVLAYVAINMINYFKNSFLNSKDARSAADVVDKTFEKAIVPSKVDETKLSDVLNRLTVKLNVLFWPDGNGMVKLLEDLSKDELDWIYLKFGTRVYQHGFLGTKKNLTLFGWFDEVLKGWRKDDMVNVWKRSTYKYVPDSTSVLSGFKL